MTAAKQARPSLTTSQAGSRLRLAKPSTAWLQKLVTFRTPRAQAGFEWPRYFATMGSSLAANLLLMYLLVTVLGLWYLAASVVVTLLFLAGNFLVNDRWSFALRR